ncbi:hypothetical protein ABZ498_17875 [Streptomyces lavendulocolor]|uniref:hypothetical protein n=1 Tax=Streptomyces lavendulocolor TaxID=67316 RepID=UPI0033CB8630
MTEDPDETPERPVPPPFMWGCCECVRLLLKLAAEWDAPAGCFWEQLQTARHIAEAHPEDVPAQHLEDCELCPEYARRQDDDAAGVWAQHRARDLFMPQTLARLW